MRSAIEKIARYADITIIGDYSLLPYSPNSIVVKQAIDLNEFRFVGYSKKKDFAKIKIVHAPSNRKIKGTDY